MKGLTEEHGLVAVLDALGASSYGPAEINRFLNARAIVLERLDIMKDEIGTIDPTHLTTFTFNDTIIVALRCGEVAPTLKRSATFAALIRKFMVDSMANGILFRGSAALGRFHVDTESNTIMGDAITDAAQWYEESEWIGVHFTPRSYLELQRMIETSEDKKAWAFIPYAVPRRGGGAIETFAINWPKIFLVPKLRPWGDDMKPRAKLLRFLSQHRVPMGTEGKYLNTLKFFDHSLRLEASRRKPR